MLPGRIGDYNLDTRPSIRFYDILGQFKCQYTVLVFREISDVRSVVRGPNAGRDALKCGPRRVNEIALSAARDPLFGGQRRPFCGPLNENVHQKVLCKRAF